MKLKNILFLKSHRFKAAEILILVSMIVTIISCSKRKDPSVDLTPQKSTLIYPNLNEACLSGTIISTTKSEILFSWSASQNTDSYEININNLLSGEVIKKTTSTINISIQLDRSTPYSWFIVSKKGKNFTKSDSWKFYNAGVGTIYYAPFPADQLTPIKGQLLTTANGKVKLEWIGTDVDNDILNYDIYFGNTINLTVYKMNHTDSTIDVPVIANNTYYWKIITKDSKGNTSDSGVHYFFVN